LHAPCLPCQRRLLLCLRDRSLSAGLSLCPGPPVCLYLSRQLR
jgi:hypothetical protein